MRPDSLSKELRLRRSWLVLSKIEFPRKEELSLTARHNTVLQLSDSLSLRPWAPSQPQDTHLNPHIRASDSLGHHPLMMPQVHQLAGASGHRHLELHERVLKLL